MTLIAAIRSLMQTNPTAILSDGATNWSLDNLEDAVRDGEDDERDYAVDPSGIYLVSCDGHIITPAVYRVL